MKTIVKLEAVPALLFSDWSQARPLTELLLQAEASIRAKPQDVSARWLLFELLCVLGRWERALKKLQAWAGLSRGFDSTAHVMRGLIRAERQRTEVFLGTRVPATVSTAQTVVPGWIGGMAQALKLELEKGGALEAIEACDVVRENALEHAPQTPGAGNLQPAFNWITDSDTRLGPVCEAILVGAYRWLPFADIASITKGVPTSLLDLVWSQVDIVLQDGVVLNGYMPMRYPLQNDSTPTRDALLLARETVWHDQGRTGVHAQGQKVWTTDAGDMALLDLRKCEFFGAAVQQALTRESCHVDA